MAHVRAEVNRITRENMELRRQLKECEECLEISVNRAKQSRERSEKLECELKRAQKVVSRIHDRCAGSGTLLAPDIQALCSGVLLHQHYPEEAAKGDAIFEGEA